MADVSPAPRPQEPRRGRRPRRTPKPIVTRRERPRVSKPVPKPVGSGRSSWLPRALALARYSGPVQLVIQETINQLLRQSKRAGDLERSALDSQLWRLTHPDSHVRGRYRRQAAVVPKPRVETRPNPVSNPATAPKIAPRAAPKPASAPQKLPEIAPRPVGRPVSRPRPAPKNLPKSAPKSRFSPPKFDFRNVFNVPTGPQVLTRFRTPGVKSPLTLPGTRPGVGTLQLPRFDPLAQPRPETERKRCKCPKPKKAKPGRGFFRVLANGQVRRKYWKTGKNHTKEYRDARNPS